MTTGELLAERDHILLAFDGPVCALFGGNVSERDVAERLRLLVGPELPPEIAHTENPFDILRYAVSCGPATARIVETQLSRLEAVAMASAPMTPGMADAVRDLHQSGFTVTAVSNNSAEVVRSFLVIHDLAPHIRRISARTSTDLTLLTPNPHLVEQAISSLGTSPQFCVMVANSPADIQAAEAASVTVIESLDQLRLEPHSG